MVRTIGRVLAMALVFVASSAALAADDGVWRVSKSSGEVWMTTSGAEQVSLGQDQELKPGDFVRTGRTGRVLLVRGEETILISPNSVIGLPTEQKDGLSTTILQQAGSILLDVEKRNVKHFEVETPYLAAVVKGTNFRVSVNAASTSVDVMRGQVEVADFKSGQIAQVLPGQAATAFANGKTGLSLSGSGTFNPIEQGKPRASSIERIMVPKTGLSAPRNASNGQSVHALGHVAGLSPNGAALTRPGVIRISASIGEVKLNFQKVTHGLAHGAVPVSGSIQRTASTSDTIWAAHTSNASAVSGSSNLSGSGSSTGNSSGSSAVVSTGPSTSTAVAVVPAAAVTAPAINSDSSDSNNSGNGNGKSQSNSNSKNNSNANGGSGRGYWIGYLLNEFNSRGRH